MLLPKTATQNILIWIGGILLSVLIALVNSLTEQLAITMHTEATVNWEVVMYDVLQTISSLLPVIALGLGLPTIGREAEARLISKVGTDTAKEALKIAVYEPPVATNDENLDVFADKFLEAIERRSKVVAQQNKSIHEQSNT